MTPATYNFPAITAGDTFPAFPIARLNTDTPEGAPIAIISGVLQVRDIGGNLVTEWVPGDGLVIEVNQATLAARYPATTRNWSVGDHSYDLKLVTSAGTHTYLRGKLPVLAAISKEA